MGYIEQNSVDHTAPMVQVLFKEHICRAWVVCLSCHPGNSCVPETPLLHPNPVVSRELGITSPPMAPLPVENWLTLELPR